MKTKEQIIKKMKALSKERQRLITNNKNMEDNHDSLLAIFGKLLAMEWVTGVKHDRFFKY